MYYNESYCLLIYLIIMNGKTNVKLNTKMQNIRLVIEVVVVSCEYVKLKH